MVNISKNSTKIVLVNILIIFCFSLAFMWTYTKMKRNLYDSKYLKTRHLVESAWSVMDHYAKQADSDKISTLEAQQRAKEVIRNLRYEKGDYFWINDMQPKMIMHPYKPELEGKDLSGLKDPKGKNLFLEMVAVCKQQTQGFVDYYWSKPGFNEPVPKISFVKLFPKWQWMIGSGIYLDDIGQELNRTLYLLLAVLSGVILICLLLSYFINKSITNQIDNSIETLKYIVKEKDYKKRLTTRTLNCSKILRCPQKDCPEYGKKTDCWNKLGTLASEREATNKCFFLMQGTYQTCAQCPVGEKGLTNEMDKLSGWINTFIKNFQEIIYTIQGNVDDLNSSSTQLSSISDEMASKAELMRGSSKDTAKATEQAAESIRSIAAASEQAGAQVAAVASSSNELSSKMEDIGVATANVSGSMNTVAAAAEEMSSAVNTVAAAIEQMYASLNEVAKNSGHGANMTSEAAEKVGQTSDIARTLGASAQQIGDVVDLIKGIADQTNLLALNASIEAAGAGDAGKGFAVVANEVKELARQTSGATEDIRDKVESMQANTAAAIQASEVIGSTIAEINTIMGTIASAVEEQTATTNEISKSIAETAQAANSVSKNVQEAAQSATEISENVQKTVHLDREILKNLDDVAQTAASIARDAAEASVGTDKVSTNVAGVSQAAQVTYQEVTEIKTHASGLSDLAKELQSMVDQFKV